jgi:multidrug efflux pump subunit AcrB
LTLFGLILVLGIVVDDAIVVLENIFRHSEMGKSIVKATLDGSRQVLAPVLASVSTTIAAFVPILFMVGGHYRPVHGGLFPRWSSSRWWPPCLKSFS